MTPEQRIEIARQEGPEFRSVSLSSSASGLRMDAHDIGPAVERTWNHDDYEFWVSVPGEALPAVYSRYSKRNTPGDWARWTSSRFFVSSIQFRTTGSLGLR